MRLIDADALKELRRQYIQGRIKFDGNEYDLIDKCPTIDSVEVKTLEAWLYKIAMNNTNNYLCDACEEIISRLDGLRVFAKERRRGDHADG